MEFLVMCFSLSSAGLLCAALQRCCARCCASEQAQARGERERERTMHTSSPAPWGCHRVTLCSQTRTLHCGSSSSSRGRSPLNLPIPKLAQGQDCRGDSNRAPLQVRRRNRRPQKAKSSCHHGGVDHSCKSAKVGPALHQRCLHSQNGDSNDVTMSGQPGAK